MRGESDDPAGAEAHQRLKIQRDISGRSEHGAAFVARAVLPAR
jgi:hypothetical protein